MHHDGLDGARSPVVTPDGKSVCAAGYGDNALVWFKRDRTTGALTPKGCIAEPDGNIDHCAQTAKAIASVGAVAVSPNGRSVYAAGESADAIVRFDRNTTTGALTPKGCIGDVDSNPDRCAKTAKGLDDPEGIAVSPDGSSVYVTAYNDYALVRFKRDKKTGALTPKGCIAEVGAGNNPDRCGQRAGGLNEPYYGSVAVSPDGAWVYTAGSAGSSIGRFKRNTTNGALTPRGCIADPANNPEGCGQTATQLNNPYAIAVSGDGRSLYAADWGNSAVVRFRRKGTGALLPRDCVADDAHNPGGCAHTAPGLYRTQWVAASKDGRSVYAAGTADNAVVRLNRDRTTGVLTPRGCVADPANNPGGCAQTALGLDAVQTLALSDDGRSLYAAGTLDNAIVRFNRSR
ncbi:MAG: beta-propeller fold lactonase family protein [Solirubrobacterales bacterium]